MTDDKQDQNSDELDIFFAVGVPVTDTNIPLEAVQAITKEAFGWALRDRRAGQIHRAILEKMKIFDAHIVREGHPIMNKSSGSQERDLKKLFAAAKKLKNILWDTEINRGKKTVTPNPFMKRALNVGETFHAPKKGDLTASEHEANKMAMTVSVRGDMEAVKRIFKRADKALAIYKKQGFQQNLDDPEGKKATGDRALTMITNHTIEVYQEFVATPRVGGELSGQTFLFLRNIVGLIYSYRPQSAAQKANSISPTPRHTPPDDKKIHSVARKLLRKTSK